MNKLIYILLCLLLASPAFAQFADTNQRSRGGEVLTTNKPSQTITSPPNANTSTHTPNLLIQPAASPISANWNANGTLFGVNGLTGFNGNLMDVGVAGTTVFRLQGPALTSGVLTVGVTNLTPGTALLLSDINFATPENGVQVVDNNNNIAATSGTTRILTVGRPGSTTDSAFNPSSGTGVFNTMEVASGVNQTGTATGITRALNVTSTLTLASDYRALEVGAATYNVSGAPPGTARWVYFNAPTIATTAGPEFITTASTVEISGAPINGNQITITNPWALLIDGGNISTAGKIGVYNGVTTAGWGVPGIEGAGRVTGQTAANASVATYTVGAADGSFYVSANVLVTTSSAESFTATVSYTDEGNTARVVTFNFSNLGGTIGSSIAFANGAVPYEGIPIHIRAKASTAITIKTAAGGTYTGCTYNAEGLITQMQ